MREHMSKPELIEHIHTGRAQFEALLAQVPPGRVQQPGVQGDWSVKDILAHVAWWEGRLTGWLNAAITGAPPEIIALEDNDAALNSLNAQIYAENRDRRLSDVLTDFHDSYELAVAAVKAVAEEDLVDPLRFAWTRGQPLWLLVADNTYSHYREHADAIASWLATSPLTV